ncbi:MAG: GlsB/YeaQ/YmgE family stress response membrane protein [Ectothiorhodospiraceae bacterium]|nr:GlsB/YeaQ/YmgE family stress response membrane protein [Ectothiorhodospiraceae bacterium]
MGLLSWLLMGLLVGAIARWIMPGPDPKGLLVTTLLGIGGAVVGGFVGSVAGFGTITGFNLGSIGLAVLGAVGLLYVHRTLSAGRR